MDAKKPEHRSSALLCRVRAFVVWSGVTKLGELCYETLAGALRNCVTKLCYETGKYCFETMGNSFVTQFRNKPVHIISIHQH